MLRRYSAQNPDAATALCFWVGSRQCLGSRLQVLTGGWHKRPPPLVRPWFVPKPGRARVRSLPCSMVGRYAHPLLLARIICITDQFLGTSLLRVHHLRRFGHRLRQLLQPNRLGRSTPRLRVGFVGNIQSVCHTRGALFRRYRTSSPGMKQCLS